MTLIHFISKLTTIHQRLTTIFAEPNFHPPATHDAPLVFYSKTSISRISRQSCLKRTASAAKKRTQFHPLRDTRQIFQKPPQNPPTAPTTSTPAFLTTLREPIRSQSKPNSAWIRSFSISLFTPAAFRRIILSSPPGGDTAAALTAEHELGGKETLMETDGSSKRYTKSSLIVLFLIGLAIIAYGFFFSRNRTPNISYLIGYNLIPFLIISTLYYFVILKPRGLRPGGIAFVAIYGALIVSSYIGYAHQQHQARQAMTQIKHDFNTFVESSMDAEGFPTTIEEQIDTAPTAAGEYGQLERLMKQHFQRMAQHQNNYLKGLEAIGWNGILDAQRILDDETFEQSRAIIQQAKELIAEYREKTYALNDLLRIDVQSMNASAGMKREFLKGFDEERKTSEKQIDEIYELEGNIVGEIEKMINLLAEDTDAWSVENDMLLFETDERLEQYNNHMQAIQVIMNRQLEIRSGAIEKANRSFDAAAN